MGTPAHSIEEISNRACKFEPVRARNIDAYSEDLKAKLGTKSDVEISNLMMVCGFNPDAPGDVKAFKSKLGIKDLETDSSHEVKPVIASSTPYRFPPAQLSLQVTDLYNALPDKEPLDPPAGGTTKAVSVGDVKSGDGSGFSSGTIGRKNKEEKKSAGKEKTKAKDETFTETAAGPWSSNRNEITPEAVLAEAPSASNLWPKDNALKMRGAKLAAEVYHNKNCNSIQTAWTLLEQVWSDARTSFVEIGAEWAACDAEQEALKARRDALQARENRLSDTISNIRRSFEERIGQDNWTELLKFDSACEAKEGAYGGPLRNIWTVTETGIPKLEMRAVVRKNA